MTTRTKSLHGVTRIVSGGQTGVDRAALEAAIALGIEHGGWCPLGRIAEDGEIPSRYQLAETDSTDYAVRTEQNVVDSDGTLILNVGLLQGGTKLTQRLVRKHKRPLFLVDFESPPAPCEVCKWLTENRIAILNVAGPRESNQPGIGDRALQFLLKMLT